MARPLDGEPPGDIASFASPGEVMQLSPNEAIVMVSGVHPVRASKVRYYEDPDLQSRILKPAHGAPIRQMMRRDEWSGHAPIPPSSKLLAALRNMNGDQSGGIRREPELSQHEEVILRTPLVENEFDAATDDSDVDTVQAAALNRSMQGLARAVSLDPDDQMGL